MDEDRELIVFSSVRKVILTFKNDLEIISEIKKEHDISLSKLYSSLEDFEVFLKNKYNIDLELTHLANHAEFLDDAKMGIIRKRVLDFGNSMRREIETEFK